jgi:hypothetical protein
MKQQVVCATGFDVSHRPHYPLIGQNNVNLREKWAEDPESYISVMTPDMPNYFMVSCDFVVFVVISKLTRMPDDGTELPWGTRLAC